METINVGIANIKAFIIELKKLDTENNIYIKPAIVALEMALLFLEEIVKD